MRALRKIRGVPVGAVFLMVLGVLLLLQTTGIVPWGIWFELWRFWPVLIIAAGVSIVFRRVFPVVGTLIVAAVLIVPVVIVAANYTAMSFENMVTVFEEPLDDLDSVNVNVGFGAGELRLDSLPESSSLLVYANLEHRNATTQMRRSGRSADLDIQMSSDRFLANLSPDTQWDISLSTAPKLSLNLDSGASHMELDLRDLRVNDLELDTGASNVEIIMPSRAGHVDAYISGGVSNIEVIIPAGVAARIETDGGLSSIEVDRHRFPKLGGDYVSSNYAAADNRIDLMIDVGLASVTVR